MKMSDNTLDQLPAAQKCNALQKDCTCTSFLYHAKV